MTRETLLFLLRALQQRQVPENMSMRLSRGSAGLEIAPDQERPGDQGFDLEERTVLVVSKTLADEMDGQRLCVVESSSGQVELHLEHSDV
ncbi:MAG: hypothetical protein ACE5F1_08425 [Planctomycetota bacterium]